MHYQIYIPGARGQDPQNLVHVGLADLVAGAEYLDVGTGPDGAAGVVCAWRKAGQAGMGYQPEKQVWRPAVAREELSAGRYWVGCWDAAPPLPKELARPYQQPGPLLRLGDGQEWMLPAAKELTREMMLSDDGSWKYDVQRQYHGYFINYVSWLQFFGSWKPGETFPFNLAADFALQGLRVNYRVVPELVNHLPLFNTENVSRVLFAICGIEVPDE